MHKQNLREYTAKPPDQTIGTLFAPSRHGQQSGGLIHDDDLRVVMDQPQRGVGGRVNKTTHAAGHSEAAARVNPWAGHETGNNGWPGAPP
jgi:hypothetical protein